MGTLDIILLIIFFGFVGAGFYFGLIHTLGAIIGVVVGVLAAGQFYDEFASFFEFIMLKPSVAKIIAFIVIFLVVSRLIGYMVHMMDKGFKLARLIPFATMVNRLGGALLGFFEATLVLGVILYVATNFEISPYINQAIDDSVLAGLFMTIATILTPLIPEALKINVMPEL